MSRAVSPEATTSQMKPAWPDLIDSGAIMAFFALLVAVPALAYALMFLDIRAYLRALRGALVRITYHFPHVPSWARYETPGCLKSLGLRLPCTPDDVRHRYRVLAEQLHPDRGGDRHQFMRLQRQFELAMAFLADRQPEFSAEEAAEETD